MKTYTEVGTLTPFTAGSTQYFGVTGIAVPRSNVTSWMGITVLAVVTLCVTAVLLYKRK